MRSAAAPRARLRTALATLGAAVALTGSAACSTPTDITTPPGDGTPTGPSSPLSHRPFPADNWWNLDISTKPVDPASSTLIAACGVRNLHPDFGSSFGIPYSGAVFDLTSNALRPPYWTSADAAGLPIFPGLVRYDEAVQLGAIDHALRFTCPRTQAGFIAPARHYASSNSSASVPPMGMRVRLMRSFDVSTFPSEVRVILRAMQKYGLILADNGSGWYVSGAPDARWDDNRLDALKSVPSSAFEVVQMGPITH